MIFFFKYLKTIYFTNH